MASFDEWVSRGAHVPYQRLVSPGGDKDVPDVPGLYLWGATRQLGEGLTEVPRYVGKTTQPLCNRFFDYSGKSSGPVGRYVPTPKSRQSEHPPQGLLATRYCEQIAEAAQSIAQGEHARHINRWKSMSDFYKDVMKEAFPPDLQRRFQSRRQLVRLWHAVDWSLHGDCDLAQLWVAFYPGTVAGPNLGAAERMMIREAAQWNYERGLPPILNRNFSSPWNAYER